MRLLIQRVSQASVTVEDKIVGKIDRGMLIFVGFHKNDTPQSIDWLVKKCVDLRIFSDQEGKMNLSIKDIEGKVLIVSQFTLYGSCDKGRRPEFTSCLSGSQAQELYNTFVDTFRATFLPVEAGIFAAKMDVQLTNDGPVTFLLER